MTGPSNSAPPSSSDSDEDPLLEQLREATRGEYDIYGELGRGGMATVYLAHEISLGRKVAIKVMSPALLHGPGMVERFKREARTAAHLSHPNIIPIYAVREAGGLLFFVMKLVEGTPLDAIMRELGKLPIPMIEAILAQVGGAFGYAHRHGVVHRDIKPSNILIDDEGWAVVADFGIAKVEESVALTQSGVAVGTPTYMSPEQCSGGTITGASDQYSLGIVAYEMLAGRPPFTGPSMMPLMFSHFHESPPPIEEFRPECPPPIREAVLRMLAKDPKTRWASMEDAVVALGGRHLSHDDPTRSHLISLARTGLTHKIVSQVQTPRSPVPRGSREAPLKDRSKPRRLNRGWLVGAGALVVAAVAVALFLRSRPPAVVSEVAPPPAPIAVPAPAPPPAAEVTPPPPSSRQAERVPPTTPIKPSTNPGTTAKAAIPETRPNVAARDSVVNVVPSAPSVVPPVPAPAPAPATVSRPAPDSAAPVAAAVDEKAAVVSAIMAYARALDQANIAEARRLYPGMSPEQRQGLEAFWKAAGTMRTQWTVSDVVVEGGVATARVQGTNLVTVPRDRPSEQRVNLRARLERRGTEWRLVALVN